MAARRVFDFHSERNQMTVWHRPDRWIDSKRRWHAYDSHGRSYCGRFYASGLAITLDDLAKRKRPKCAECCTKAERTRSDDIRSEDQ